MRRSSAVPLGRGYLALAALAASASLVAACSDESDEQVYCTDQDGVIVDDDLCDDDDGHGTYFFRAGNYGRGLRPGDRITGGTRFGVNDSAARARYGLPSTGRVSNGTVVSGGFGGSGHISGG